MRRGFAVVCVLFVVFCAGVAMAADPSSSGASDAMSGMLGTALGQSPLLLYAYAVSQKIDKLQASVEAANERIFALVAARLEPSKH
jgi:hypothetical protein